MIQHHHIAAIGRRAGSSPPLSTKVVWWDASLLVGADNSDVTSMPDQAGGGFHLGGIGSAPILKTASLNGLNTLEFNGSSDQMLVATLNVNTDWGISTDAAFFMVIKRRGGSGATFMCDMAASTNRLGFYYVNSGNVIVDFGSASGGSGRCSFAYAGADTNWVVLAIVVDNFHMRMWRDGASIFDSVSAFSDADGIVSGSGAFILGADTLGAGYGELNFAEMYVVNTVPTDVQIANEIDLLKTKWGIA